MKAGITDTALDLAQLRKEADDAINPKHLSGPAKFRRERAGLGPVEPTEDGDEGDSNQSPDS
jgi:hypothetical protein